eukprot:SAG22_NODE_11972_length_461_cov_1.306630_1_plen_148_part_01
MNWPVVQETVPVPVPRFVPRIVARDRTWSCEEGDPRSASMMQSAERRRGGGGGGTQRQGSSSARAFAPGSRASSSRGGGGKRLAQSARGLSVADAVRNWHSSGQVTHEDSTPVLLEGSGPFAQPVRCRCRCPRHLLPLSGNATLSTRR